MAAPNIVGVTTILGVTTSLTLTSSLQTILSNAAGSGKVYKINMINASNFSGATANVTVNYNQGAAGAGTTIAIVNGADIATKSSLIILDKASSIYLEEDRSLTAVASANTAIDMIVSYEDITNL